MTTYIFDLTPTARYLESVNRFTGIQRAAVMLIEKAAVRLGAEHVYIGVYDTARSKYRVFPFSSLDPGELTNAEALRMRLVHQDHLRALHPLLSKYKNKPSKLWFHRTKYNISSALNMERAFARKKTTIEQWRASHGGEQPEPKELEFAPLDAVAGPGDQLILLDATFTVPRLAESFRHARMSGITISLLIYDLIPIVVPETNPNNGRQLFYDWLLETASYTDRYLADSASAGRDLQAFLDTHGIDRPISVMRLAQAPIPTEGEKSVDPASAGVDAATYPKVIEALRISDKVLAVSKYPFVLCVGTLEARKNNWRLATAWDRLRRIDGLRLPKLVFAGRRGWMNDDFDRLMQSTGQLGGWVEIVEGPSDRELEFLYRNCEFAAMPSLYEGWGLPVGEALSYGKTAVISDVSSLPEVGLDLVEYCDPTLIDSIVDACLRLIANPSRRMELEAKIRDTTLRSWDDVAHDLVSAVVRD